MWPVDLVSSHTHEGLEPSVTRWVAIWDLCQPHTQLRVAIPGTAGTWNPLLAMPMTTPPPAPGFLAVYENPTLGQFISPGGTSLVTRQDSFDIHPDHWFSLSAARRVARLLDPPASAPHGWLYLLCASPRQGSQPQSMAPLTSHLPATGTPGPQGFIRSSRNCRATGSCGAFRAYQFKRESETPCVPFCVPL